MTKTESKNDNSSVENRFELCLVASKRAKDILSGAPTIRDKSVKSPIIALDEINNDELDIEQIRKNIAAGDNIYQSEVIEDNTNEGKTLPAGKNDIFVNENLVVID